MICVTSNVTLTPNWTIKHVSGPEKMPTKIVNTALKTNYQAYFSKDGKIAVTQDPIYRDAVFASQFLILTWIPWWTCLDIEARCEKGFREVSAPAWPGGQSGAASRRETSSYDTVPSTSNTNTHVVPLLKMRAKYFYYAASMTANRLKPSTYRR